MDMAYIAEYGNRNALLDLSKVDVSKFTEGTVDSGKINEQLVGINAGVNSALIFANPAIFEKAKMDAARRQDLDLGPMIEIAAEVAAKAKRAVRHRARPFDQRRDVRRVRPAERQGAVHPRRSRVRAPPTPRPGST